MFRSGLNLSGIPDTDSNVAEPPLHSDVVLADLAAWVQMHGSRLLRSAYLLCGDRTG